MGIEFALARISSLAETNIGRRKRASLQSELASLHDARLSRLVSLTRRIGKSARALRGAKDTDPVEIGGAILARIWGGRVDGVLERADILSEKLENKLKPIGTSSARSAIRRKVFISYRRRDAGALARRLVVALSAAFPRSHFFLDRIDITPGGPWQQELEAAVAQCSHVLAVIGPDWVGGTVLGDRRIDSPIDPVRLEIETALEFERRLLPVITDSAQFPPANLPVSIRSIGSINGVILSDDLTAQDFDTIRRFLELF